MERDGMYMMLLIFGSIASYRVAKYISQEKNRSFDTDGPLVFLAIGSMLFIIREWNDSCHAYNQNSNGMLYSALTMICFFFVVGLLAARDHVELVICENGDRYKHPSLLDIERAYSCTSDLLASYFVLGLGWAIFLFFPAPSIFTGILRIVIAEITGDTRKYSDKRVSLSSYTKALVEMNDHSADSLAKDLGLSNSQIDKLRAMRRNPFTDGQT